MIAFVNKKHPDQITSTFCAANNINEVSYYYWLKKSKQATLDGSAGFVPVQLSPTDRTLIATIRLPGGSIISVYDIQAISFMQFHL